MAGERQNGRLKGLRVCVVEDEFSVLLMMEDMLAELGCEVVRSASRLSDAMALARRCNAGVAVLDINIGGELVFPAAEILCARGIPIVFATGYGAAGVDAAWRTRPVLQKPFRIEQLAMALERAIAN